MCGPYLLDIFSLHLNTPWSPYNNDTREAPHTSADVLKLCMRSALRALSQLLKFTQGPSGLRKWRARGTLGASGLSSAGLFKHRGKLSNIYICMHRRHSQTKHFPGALHSIRDVFALAKAARCFSGSLLLTGQK